METRIDILRSFLKETKAERAAEEDTVSYSATMRKLRKSNPELVRPFMKSFKSAFDNAVNENMEDAEKLALMEARKSVDV